MRDPAVRDPAWRPTPLIRASIALHGLALAAVIAEPAQWLWALGAVVINHLLLTAVGLWPRSNWLGENWVHLPAAATARNEIALTIDDGPDPEVTPQVLDILDRFQAKATFFCIGRLAVKHPELCREIVRRGHAIENHSMSHNWYFSLLDPWSIHREVLSAQAVLGEISGQAPRFFRATAGLRNPALDPVLAHNELRLCSWNKRGFDTRVGDADAVFDSLTHELKAGDILLLHDGNAARTAGGKAVILDVLPRLLDKLAQANLHSTTLRTAIP